jgi:predicted O-methyltransferase YrrM
MKFSRLIKIKEYVSAAGLFEVLKDLKYLLRRSFLGLPRLELLEVFNLEDNEFKITIPNYCHGSKRNASLTISEKIVIAILCNLLKPKMVIEIGTFRGETTDLMAHNLVDADIYTLDLPADSTNHSYRPDPDNLEVLKLRKPDSYIQPCYVTNSRIHQIYGDSAEFAFEKLNQTFELAFIDGAHSYEYVKNDTEKLLPLMKPGGWIIWDDYCFSFPEVIQYVNTFRQKGAFHIYGTRLAALKV